MATLNIDDRILAAWKARATAEGLSVEEWLEDQTAATATARPSLLTHEEWHRRLRALAQRHPPTGVPLNDSRESIYE
ncbi:MAG: hypothetical protein ACK5Q5_14410 [Planctomycetaceae bacterium]